jgi:hypothetical protein
MSSDHSPGPWFIGAERDTAHEGNVTALNADGPFLIAWVRLDSRTHLRGVTLANLRLLRAAPELLEAIDVAIACLLEGRPDSGAVLEDVLRTLATARAGVAPSSGVPYRQVGQTSAGVAKNRRAI